MDSDAVGMFCDITGASPAVAARVLDMAGGHLETAIQLFYENPELQVNPDATPAQPRTPQASDPTPTHRHRPIGRQDVHGVIHLDSDDDDDEITLDEEDNNDEVEVVAQMARDAQEEEDAAIAKRMQEELYSEGPADPDRVRSPIARRTETLIAPDPAWGSEGDEADSYMDEMRQRVFLDTMRARRELERLFSFFILFSPAKRVAPLTPNQHQIRYINGTKFRC